MHFDWKLVDLHTSMHVFGACLEVVWRFELKTL